MEVIIKNHKSKSIWSFGLHDKQSFGSSCQKYREDGTLNEIIAILERAIFQAKGELSLSPDNVD